MENDPNKLASKVLPGPYTLVRTPETGLWLRNTGGMICTFRKPDSFPGQQLRYVEDCEAIEETAHMMEQSLNMRDFISDLLHELQNYGFLSEPEKWIDRGEQITKKAYNF